MKHGQTWHGQASQRLLNVGKGQSRRCRIGGLDEAGLEDKTARRLFAYHGERCTFVWSIRREC